MSLPPDPHELPRDLTHHDFMPWDPRVVVDDPDAEEAFWTAR